jgi:hypothetical protein
MRQDKTIARILLISFVANVALAAPAVVRQRHLDVAKAASEKRASSNDEITDESESAPLLHNIPSFVEYPEIWEWLEESHDSAPPAEPDWSYDDPAPVSPAMRPMTELGRTIKVVMTAGAVIGVSAGIISYGVHKIIKHSGTYVSPLFAPSPPDI